MKEREPRQGRIGHGTLFAGIASGNGWSSTGAQYTKTFRGLAPRIELISLRALDATGNGTDAAVIAVIERGVQFKSTRFGQRHRGPRQQLAFHRAQR